MAWRIVRPDTEPARCLASANRTRGADCTGCSTRQRVRWQPLSHARSSGMSYSVSPIGFVRSCFKEKFAIPRQPQLAPAARGVLELTPPFDQARALDGLEQVSHVWLLFLFHEALEAQPRLRVRPPRL